MPEEIAQFLAALLVEMQLSLVTFELVHDLPYTRTRSSTQALQQQSALLARVQRRIANPSLEEL